MDTQNIVNNLTPSTFTRQKFEEIKKLLPFDDQTDFDNAMRGFIATVESGVILNNDGTTSYNMKDWDFLKDDAPDTANPSLWRQGQLNRIHGLFEVVEGKCSFSTHNWPLWENENIVPYWEEQRDMYRYIHDQTVRLANEGYTPIEIAESLKLPETIANKFPNRGYYGTVSHNVKAQYQLYFGWFDGNPANLDPLPPVDAGKKYVEAMGGAEAVLIIAQKAYNEGDYRWGAMLLNHLVFANPANTDARNLLAETYIQLGFQAESGPWRNFYLSGACELCNKPNNQPIEKIKAIPEELLETLDNMPPETLFDYLGVKIDGIKAAKENFTFNIQFIDEANSTHTLILNNGALTNRINALLAAANATITAQKTDFNTLLIQPLKLDAMIENRKITLTGDKAAFEKFLSLIHFDTVYFNIIEP